MAYLHVHTLPVSFAPNKTKLKSLILYATLTSIPQLPLQQLSLKQTSFKVYSQQQQQQPYVSVLLINNEKYFRSNKNYSTATNNRGWSKLFFCLPLKQHQQTSSQHYFRVCHKQMTDKISLKNIYQSLYNYSAPTTTTTTITTTTATTTCFMFFSNNCNSSAVNRIKVTLMI